MIFARHWIQTKDRVRSAFLRPVPGGYIFRAPNPKVFGAPDHYLVNEAQRDAILAIMFPHRAPLLLVLCLSGLLLAASAGLMVLAPGYPATVSARAKRSRHQKHFPSRHDWKPCDG